MKASIITNNGPDNLRIVLRTHLASASEANFAVAFVTHAGLESVLPQLQQVTRRGRVRIITGLYQCVTEPKALRALLRVQDASHGKLSVRLSREPGFHKKVYLLSGKKGMLLLCGSSNLTREGLQSEGEMDFVLPVGRHTAFARELSTQFDSEWEHKAVPLNKQQIVRYEKNRPDMPYGKDFTPRTLASILGGPVEENPPGEPSIPPRYWTDAATGLVDDKTKRAIEAETDWDKRGFGWISLGSLTRYRIGDELVFFDLPGKCAVIADVKATVRTSVPTPDGRHFMAYREQSRYRKNFSRNLWNALKEEGLSQRNVKTRRLLGRHKFERLKDLLSRKRRRK